LKANPKMKADPKADAAATGSKKKLMMIVGGAVLVLGVGAGAGWFFTHQGDDGAASKKEQKAVKAEPPEYVPVDAFTVNLQPEAGDQYLQVQFTLQVANLEQVELIKANMAKVRSRVLLLLSGKKASEINTVDGKRQLASEILVALKEPFVPKGNPQEVTDVLFTSFIIQ
jgi:flagellar FliL protein